MEKNLNTQQNVRFCTEPYFQSVESAHPTNHEISNRSANTLGNGIIHVMPQEHSYYDYSATSPEPEYSGQNNFARYYLEAKELVDSRHSFTRSILQPMDRHKKGIRDRPGQFKKEKGPTESLSSIENTQAALLQSYKDTTTCMQDTSTLCRAAHGQQHTGPEDIRISMAAMIIAKENYLTTFAVIGDGK